MPSPAVAYLYLFLKEGPTGWGSEPLNCPGAVSQMLIWARIVAFDSRCCGGTTFYNPTHVGGTKVASSASRSTLGIRYRPHPISGNIFGRLAFSLRADPLVHGFPKSTAAFIMCR